MNYTKKASNLNLSQMDILKASIVSQMFNRSQTKPKEFPKPEIAPKLIGRRGVTMITVEDQQK